MAEQIVYSDTPLQDAFTHLNGKISRAHHAIDGAKGILTNKFPQNQANAYVTGLYGYYELPEKLTIGVGMYAQIFSSDANLYWQIRWDYDSSKGPHVNANFEKNPSVKFAYQLNSEQYAAGNPKKTMKLITDELNDVVGYDQSSNWGKNQPTWPKGERQAIEDLGSYFKHVLDKSQ